MELKQYAAEHIIENGKHYPEKWVNRYFIELADAQRALDAEREMVKGLEEWKRIVTGAGTDHESVVRLAAHEYTKTAVQCWKDANATLQAQLRQVEGQSKQQAEEAVLVFAKYTTLRQLVEALLVRLDEIDHYQQHPDRGDSGAECACCMGELLTSDDRVKMDKARATLAVQDAKEGELYGRTEQ